MTHGDRVRQMSNEELAEIFSGNCTYCAYAKGLEKECKGSCTRGIKEYFDSEEEV
jgi:hypothetical protein